MVSTKSPFYVFLHGWFSRADTTKYDVTLKTVQLTGGGFKHIQAKNLTWLAFAEGHLLKQCLAKLHVTQQRWEEAHRLKGRTGKPLLPW